METIEVCYHYLAHYSLYDHTHMETIEVCYHYLAQYPLYDHTHMETIEVCYHYHIIYKSSNRNKVHDKFGIMYFENRITMQIRSRD